MTMTVALALILAVAVAIAWVRLILWWRATLSEDRGSPWRLAILLAAQPLLAAMLFLGLAPREESVGSDTLVVATRGAAAGEGTIALPEARALPGAIREPDLATALRHRPNVRHLHIKGDGLVARDRDAARGLAIDFAPPRRAACCIVSLDPPKPSAPGGAFQVSGRIADGTDAMVELVDPAGAMVDHVRPAGDSVFALTGMGRTAGFVAFTLRVRDAGGKVIEQAPVPLWTRAETAPAMALIAGAPGPEPKYLRRWATDAGVSLRTEMQAGGGVRLGDAAVPLDPAALRRLDLLVLDERSWAGMGGGTRGAVVAAVRDGLGLLLRASGPVDAGVRGQWRGLGFALSADRGDAPARIGAVAGVNRRRVDLQARDGVPLVRDVGGAPLGQWRAVGRGRIGLWTITDTFALALGGDRAGYERLWSDALATLARPRAATDAILDPLPQQGQRMRICGLPGPAQVEPPTGPAVRLIADASRCAAFWPSNAGWHLLRIVSAKQATPFYVYDATALPALRSAADTAATAHLALTAPLWRAQPRTLLRSGDPRWWLLAWLGASALLWWFERYGRKRPPSA